MKSFITSIVCVAISLFSIGQEIDITGRNITIVDGATSTTKNNNTKFGEQVSSSGKIAKTFTIWNRGNSNLVLSGSPKVASSNSDFTVSSQPTSPIPPGGQTTFTIEFDPSSVATITSAISIANNDANENPYNFNVSGVGITSRTAHWVNNQSATRPTTVTVDGVSYNTAATTYTTIQSAITAASTYDIVYITDGTYFNSFETTSTSCLISGTGQDFNLALELNNKNYITITSETGDFRTSSARLVGYGFSIRGGSGITIQGLEMDSVRLNGFWNSNCCTYTPSYDLKILNNKVINTRGHGIKTDSWGSGGGSISEKGAWEISGNHFENIGFYNGYGNCNTPGFVSAMWIAEAGSSFLISNNTIKNTKWAGILCDGFGYPNSATAGAVTICGNTISQTIDAGIQVGYGSGNYYVPNNAFITDNKLFNCNTTSKVGIGPITILQSNIKGAQIYRNDITSSFNGLAIEIAGWQNSPDTTYVRYNNFYSLSGGYAITHIAGIAPNGLYGTGDDLNMYKFDNNYFGSSTGPTYATNSGGTGAGLKKDANTLGGGTYSLNDFNYTPFLISPNLVGQGGGCMCDASSFVGLGISQAYSKNISCEGLSDGIAVAKIDSGVPPYSFRWSNGDSTIGIGNTIDTISGLAAGSYTVTVTDGNSQTDTVSFTLTNTFSIANQTVSAADTSLCTTSGTTISTSSSVSGISYSLYDSSNTLVDGPKAGTGSGLNFSTGSFSSKKSFYVKGEKTPSTGLDCKGAARVTLTGFNISPGIYPTFTAEAWIKITDNTTLQTVVGNDNGGYDRGIVIWGGTYHVFAGRDINTSIVPVLNTWQHVAMTWSSTAITVYVNGSLVYSTTGESASTGPADSYISGTYSLKGIVDEVKMWNTIRTASEISTNMNVELTGSETGLLAYYKFNEGSGSSATDLTSNNRTGTISSFNASTDWVTGYSSGPACSKTMNNGTLTSIVVNTPLSAAIDTSNGKCVGAELNLSNAGAASKIVWSLNGAKVDSSALSAYATGTTVVGGNGSGSGLNQFNQATGVVLDSSGNIFIADVMNHRIMKWVPGASAGTVYATGLSRPTGLFMDKKDNLYVADRFNNRILKIAPGGTPKTVVAGGNGAGSGLNQLNNPLGVYLDANDTMYIADYINFRIMKWAPGASSGTVAAGTGAASSAANGFNYPTNVTLDSKGNLIVVDNGNYRIQKFPKGSNGSTNGVTIAGGNGNGSAGNQLGWNLFGIAFDKDDNLYISDHRYYRIKMFPKGSTSSTNGIVVAGGNGSGTAANQLHWPTGLYFDKDDNLYVGDIVLSERIQKFTFNASTKFTTTAAGNHSAVVTSKLGCVSYSDTVTIGETPTMSVTNAICGNDGAMSVSTTGAIGPFSYTWSNSATTSSISSIDTGIFTVTVTYAGGCTAVLSDTVKQGPNAKGSAIIYGATGQGGSTNNGVFYSFNTSNNTATVLHDFTGTPDGKYPQYMTYASNGKIYGLTAQGGANATNNGGIIFEYDAAVDTFKKLYDFPANEYPFTSMQEYTSGIFYGVTRFGPKLYKFDASTNTVTFLHTFGASDQPQGEIVLVNGKYYGSTSAGGTASKGYIYSFDPTTNTTSTVYNFTGNDGSVNLGGLMLASNGKIYGAAQSGGSNNLGTLYEFNPSNNTFTLKHTFATATGQYPFSRLVEGDNGNLYGTTMSGGTSSKGVIFGFNYNTNTYTVLKNFAGGTDGDKPVNGFLKASDGWYYAGTERGGTSGLGLLFKFNPSNSAYTVIHNFNGTNGKWLSQSSLIEGTPNLGVGPRLAADTIVVDSNATCNGLANAGATASATGGYGPYTYAWSNNATTASITGVTAGSYKVTITDQKGCKDSATVTLTQPAAITKESLTATDTAVCAGNGTTITTNSSQNSISYTLKNAANDSVIAGPTAGTGSSLSFATGNLNANTNYYVEASSASGNTALDFNGTSNYVRGTNYANLNFSSTDSFSIDVWIKAAVSTLSYQTIVGKYDGNYDGWALQLSNGQPELYLYKNGGYIYERAAVDLRDGNWHHIAATYNGNKNRTGLVYYVDGQTVSQVNAGNSLTGDISNTASVGIGAAMFGSSVGYYFKGVIDNIKVWNGVRTQSEVQTSMNSSATGSEANLVVAYNFNEGTDTTLNDLTSNNYNGTLTNMDPNTDWVAGYGGSSFVCSVNSDTVSVAVNMSPIASATLDSALLCNGATNGVATASATSGQAPYTYSWSNSDSTAKANGLGANSYYVTVTDANGCSDSASITLTQPTALVASASVTSNYNGANISCNGVSDGQATASATGGTVGSGYTYSWSNSFTGAVDTALAAGSYYVTVTDSKGCFDSASVMLTQPTVVNASAAITSNYNGANISCFGENDGQATASATGGTVGSGYSYSWSNSTSTAIASALSDSSYYVSVTDVNGCQDSASVTLSAPTQIVASAVMDSVSGCATPSGGATASGTGGTGVYGYSWSNSATTASITGVSANSYYVSISDINGCTDSASVSISNATGPVATITLDSNVTCFGLTNGGASISATGGTSPITYSWSNSDTTTSISGVAAGTYSVTVSDAFSCSDVKTVTISQPTQLVATATLNANDTCGNSNGGATSSATGGTGAYSFAWSNSATTAIINGLTANSYYVSVSDTNNCTDSASVVVAAIGQTLDATIDTSNGKCVGAELNLSQATGASKIIWNLSGTAIDSSFAPSSRIGVTVAGGNGNGSGLNQFASPYSLIEDKAGNIYVNDDVNHRIMKWAPNATAGTVVAGGNGSGTALNQISQPIGIDLDATGNLYICEYGNRRITRWAPGDTQGVIVVGGNGYGNALNQLAGPRDVKIASNGDIYVADGDNSRFIKFPPNSTSTTNGTIIATGVTARSFTLDASDNIYFTNPFQFGVYKWAVGASSAVLVAGGNGEGTGANQFGQSIFGIDVDASGNLFVSDYRNHRVQKFPANSTSSTNGITVAGDTTGGRILGGSAYLLNYILGIYVNDAGQLFVSDAGNKRVQKFQVGISTSYKTTAAGNHSAIVTSKLGCVSYSDTVAINANPIASATLDSAITCNGASNGVALASATSGQTPYTYSWSNSVTTAAANGLGTGSYYVTVTDAKSCSDSASITLIEPTSLVASANITSNYNGANISCNGVSDGQATASATGGTVGSGYSYSWSNSFSGEVDTALAAGSYYVTVTDINGCFDSASVMLTEPATIVASAAITSNYNGANISCFGENDGQATASATGGTVGSGYTYSWSNSTSTAIASALSDSSYYVSVTDVNGCQDSASVTLSAPTQIVASAVMDSVSGCATPSGGATASGTGGTGVYGYSWSNSATTASITGVSANSYYVSISDINGCTDSASVTVSTATGPVATITLDSNVTCFGLTNGGASISVTGGTSPITYAWSNSATTTGITGVAAGTYSVTVSDAFSCSDVKTVMISEPTKLVVTASLDSNVECSGELNGGASATVTGGTGAYSYSWSNSNATSSIAGVGPGSYSITAMDTNGCTSSDTVIIITNVVINNQALTVSDSALCTGLGTVVNTASSQTNVSYAMYNTNAILVDGPKTGTGAALSFNTGNLSTSTDYYVQAKDVNANFALDFDGVNDYVKIGDPFYSFGTTATMEGWVKFNNTSVWMGQAAEGTDNGSTNMWLWHAYTGNNFQFVVYTASGQRDVVTSGISTGWHHVATVVSSTAVQVYIDGVLNGSTTGVPAAITNNASSVLYLGKDPRYATGGNIRAFQLDNFRVWNKAMSQSEVQSAMTAVLSGSETGLKTALNFNEGTGTTTADLTGNSSSITLNNMDPNTDWVVGQGLSGGGKCTINSNDTVSVIAYPNPIAIAIIDSAILCNGLTNGGASASATSGNAPYAYSWSNSDTSASITGIGASSYYVTITDANSCSDSASIMLTQPTAVVASAVVDSNVSCFGSNTGVATAFGSGGTIGSGSYSYSWSNSDTNSTASGLIAGSYYVTVSDSLGCMDSGSVNITQPNSALVTTAILVNNVTCNGGVNGVAATSATGGTSPYSFAWNTTSTNDTVGSLVAGTYHVTSTDARGCTSMDSIVITEPAAMLVTINKDSNVSCFGGANGKVTALITGGSSPYSYSWSNGAGSDSTRSNLSAGNYSVTIVDANNCSISDTFSIAQPSALVADVALIQNVSCFGDSTGSALGSALGGTSPYAYSWSNSTTNDTASGLYATTYVLTVFDTLGCSDMDTITIAQPTVLIASAVMDTSVSCFGFSNGSAMAQATGGNGGYSYAWSNMDTTARATGLAASTFVVTITDSLGCNDTASVTISQPNALAVNATLDSNATCNGSADGGASALASGGTGPYSYSWSNSDTTATIVGALPNTYMVTATDANGCTAFDTVVVLGSTAIIPSAVVDSNVTCFGYSNGGASVTVTGGTSPFKYDWNNNDTTMATSGLMAGTYTVKLTDSLGCTAMDTVIISQPTAISVVIQLDSNASCFGYNNGGASAMASGGTGLINFLWSTSDTTNSIDSIGAGTYLLTVTDSNSCVAIDSISIAQPTPISIVMNVDTNVSCFGGMNGNASASAQGGTGSLAYTWNTSDTTMQINAQLAGTYFVTVTDSTKCFNIDSVVITQPNVLTLAFDSLIQPECNMDSTGFARTMISGGTAPYSYNWSNADTNSSVSKLAKGMLYVTVTDKQLCMITDSILIQAIDTIRPTVLSIASDTLYLDNSGMASILVADINAGSMDNCGIETLSLSQSSFSCNDTGWMVLTLTGIDTAGNINSSKTNLLVLDTVSPSFIVCPSDTVICSPDTTGHNVDFAAIGGSDNCSFTISQLSGLSNGAFYPIGVTQNQYTIVDPSGNSSSCAFDITVHKSPLVDLGVGRKICADKKHTLEVTNSNVSIIWLSDSSTGKTFVAPDQGNGLIIVSVTDLSNQCTTLDSVVVTYVEVCVGVSELLSDVATIQYYPNPNKGSFTLDAKGLTGKVNLTITDTRGRVVQSIDWEDGQSLDKATIELTDAQSGMYILILTEDRGRAIHRISIER